MGGMTQQSTTLLESPTATLENFLRLMMLQRLRSPEIQQNLLYPQTGHRGPAESAQCRLDQRLLHSPEPYMGPWGATIIRELSQDR